MYSRQRKVSFYLIWKRFNEFSLLYILAVKMTPMTTHKIRNLNYILQASEVDFL